MSSTSMITGETAVVRPTRGNSNVCDTVNVGEAERWASVVGGGLLLFRGLERGSLFGIGEAALGSGLIYRGLSGHCSLYSALGVDTAGSRRSAAVAAGHGVKIDETLLVRRPADELYRYWRHFENLPKFMTSLVSVESNDGGRSHWVAHGPTGNVAWDADIINEEPGRLIAWRSVPGSDISMAGSVHFNPRGHGLGTEVRVVLKYDSSAGKVGSWIARLVGEDPKQQIREDLQRFKQLMETGEIATVEGQPVGRR